MRGCRGLDNAALLSLRGHRQYRVEDGINGRTLENSPKQRDEGSIDASRRLLHRVPRTNRRQGQRQNADVLAAGEAGLRERTADAASVGVSYTQQILDASMRPYIVSSRLSRARVPAFDQPSATRARL